MKPHGRYRFLTPFDTVQVGDLGRVLKYEYGEPELSAHAEQWDEIKEHAAYECKGYRILGRPYHEISEFWEVIRRVE